MTVKRRVKETRYVPTTHPRCGAVWAGSRIEHCPACCRSFSNTRAGDRHRAGPHAARYCLDPVEAGLLYDPGRKLWRLPGNNPFREKEPRDDR